MTTCILMSLEFEQDMTDAPQIKGNTTEKLNENKSLPSPFAGEKQLCRNNTIVSKLNI